MKQKTKSNTKSLFIDMKRNATNDRNNFNSLLYCKLALILVFTGCFSLTRSQSLDIGGRGAIGTCDFMNPNVTSGTEQNNRFVVSYNFGFHSAFNFKNGNCLEFDILYGYLNQGYNGSFTNSGGLPGVGLTYQAGQSYTSENKINIIEIPFLYRYEGQSGLYVEAGSGYQVIIGATYSATYSNPSLMESYNTKSDYPVGDFPAIIGVGWDIDLSGVNDFYLNIGIRAEYGLLDLGGVDGHGQALLGAKASSVYQNNYGAPYYASYRETHTFEATFNVALFYSISETVAHVGGRPDSER